MQMEFAELLIFQCDWELVKIHHFECGDPARTLYPDMETDNRDLMNEKCRFIKKIHRHFNQMFLLSLRSYRE